MGLLKQGEDYALMEDSIDEAVREVKKALTTDIVPNIHNHMMETISDSEEDAEGKSSMTETYTEIGADTGNEGLAKYWSQHQHRSL